MNASDQSVKKLAIQLSRSPRLSIAVILAAVCSLWLLAVTFSPSTGLSGVPLEHAVPNDVPKKVVVRTIPTNIAGLGSVVAQLRSSAAIATMLGASFATFSIPSIHVTRSFSIPSTHVARYNAASLLHFDLLEAQLPAGTKVCSIASSPHHARTVELMESWCNNVTVGDAHTLELQGLWSDCGLILDDRPWDVRYDMSKCTWKWVKHVFSRLGLKKRRRGIGLHIRWGDISTMWVPPERSTPVDLAAKMLRKMRECGVQDELRVYMEGHNDTILSGLGEPYRIVDTGDAIDDLLDLAANRLLILDSSSWTVLAHQIAEGGVTIPPDIDKYEGYESFYIPWGDNGMNDVIRWNKLLSTPCSELSILLDS